MGKNHSSVVVLRIQPKFWWMLPMGVRDNHTSMSQKVNGGDREQASQCRTSISKSAIYGRNQPFFFCPKLPKNLMKTAK